MVASLCKEKGRKKGTGCFRSVLPEPSHQKVGGTVPSGVFYNNSKKIRVKAEGQRVRKFKNFRRVDNTRGG